MAAVIRVGAGALVDRYQPDVLEEIRIMAEAAREPLVRTASPPRRPMPSAFQRLLGAVLSSVAN